MIHNFTKDPDVDITIIITPYQDIVDIKLYPSYKDGSMAYMIDAFVQDLLERIRTRVNHLLGEPMDETALNRILNLVKAELDNVVYTGGFRPYLIG